MTAWNIVQTSQGAGAHLSGLSVAPWQYEWQYRHGSSSSAIRLDVEYLERDTRKTKHSHLMRLEVRGPGADMHAFD